MSLRIVVATVIIVGVTVVSGVLHGRATLRWSANDSSEFIALSSLPTTIGHWRMTDEHEISGVALDTLRADDSVYRTYGNTETGQRVEVAIIAGPHGPISVHLPEICYSSQKYEQIQQRKRVLVESDGRPTNEFWSLDLRANNVHASPLVVLYGWSVGEEWKAPESARRHFAGSSRLLKLQISGARSSPVAEGTDNACVDFLRAFAESIDTLNSQS